jgi:hypothetical protein
MAITSIGILDNTQELKSEDSTFQPKYHVQYGLKGRGGRDRMVLGFTTTHATSDYHDYSCEFEYRSWRDVLDLIQHYVIKFVSDLRQVGSFLRCPPPIKLTATI